MRYIYLTAKKYPGNTADHHYVNNLAQAFHAELGKDFIFITQNTEKAILPDLPIVNVFVPTFLKKTAVFFFWIPWFYFRKIRPSRRSNEPVVFFSNDINLLTLMVFWRFILILPIKIVVDWHHLTGVWKEKFVAEHVDFSITTSEKLKRAVSKLAPSSYVKTVYGGVFLEPYRSFDNFETVRKQLGLPLDKFLIGYVGLFRTLGQEKGILTMIDSLKNLGPDNFMVFVGGKSDEIISYKGYAEKLNVHNRCVFISIQSFQNVVLYEKVMNILVIPYPDKPHFRNFGFPMKIYEYMAAKVPIIYTQLELLEEVVSDCAYGIKPDDPGALAKTIEYVRSHSDESRQKSLKAFEKVQQYSWISKAKNIISAII